MSEREAEIDAIREAVAEMDDEWSRNRAMGQDRIEWGTWRALIGWLTNVADRMAYADRPTPEQSHAVHIACTYLGRIDPRDPSAAPAVSVPTDSVTNNNENGD
jgi:hypothetical protein